MILEYTNYGPWLILFVVIYLLLKRIIEKEKVKVKLKGQITEARLEALQAQMNPHFIFNALNQFHENGKAGAGVTKVKAPPWPLAQQPSTQLLSK